MEKKTSKTLKLNLYKKEQFVLCVILLCFMLSGIVLPKVDNYLHPGSPPEDDFIETVTPVPDTNEVISPPSKDEDTSNEPDISHSQENAENSTDAFEPTTNVQSSDQSDYSNNFSSSSSKTPEKEPEKEPVNEPTNKPTTEIPKEPEKVWVPPVYEIIHHEAIYETIRVVICNYCSEEFSTVGEFQVHKNAHGG